MERRIAPSAKIEEAIEEVLLGGLDDPDRLTELGRLGAQLVLQRAIEEVNRPDFDGGSCEWRNMKSWQTRTATAPGEPARGSIHPN